MGDVNGFLKTGDVGTKAPQTSFVHITGRLKELIITAGGENVAPVPIESHLLALCPALSHCVLIGDGRKYLTVLVTVRTRSERSVQLEGEATEVDMACHTVKDAQASEAWRRYVQKGLEAYNEDKEKCVSRAQRVQYFAILDGDFSVETGEMTSTMKLKRSVIREKYKDVIASLYTQT